MKLKKLTSLMLASSLISVSSAAYSASDDLRSRVNQVLTRHPVIDGHNDLAWEIRTRFDADFSKIDLRLDTEKLPIPATAEPDAFALMTDIPRLKTGHVGGQFWSVWIPVSVTGPAAVKMTLEQIDLVKRMVQTYPANFVMAYTAEDIEQNFKSGKVASLIGIEGGHQIDNSLATLRQMYDLGARYMTLTHTSNTDWADSATDNPVHHGLTPFGKKLVQEMNRLGMLIDLSHVSEKTMQQALEISQAPVIFSHSSARALVDHPRDVSDEMLKLVAKKHGVVMVNFFSAYVSQALATWFSEYFSEQSRLSSPPYAGLYLGQPERAKEAMAQWLKIHPKPVVTLSMVADHIEHIRKIAGIDSVGIGSDFDGVPSVPEGLDGVDKYPKLFEELARRGWSDVDLGKLASGNILTVLRDAEVVAKKLQTTVLPALDKP